jgi:glucose/arabinose dehydrogenase/lysophospholipase L1-like esterase
LLFAFTLSAADPALKLEKGDHVVIVGNTLAERMNYFGNFETLLHSRFPEHNLYVRNLGWSADEVSLRPRSKDYRDHTNNLSDHKPNVLIAMFGFNESFADEAGLPRFEADLEGFLKSPEKIDNYSTGRSNWDSTADKKVDLPKLESLRQIVLVSPITFENTGRHGLPDGKEANARLKLYTEAMGRVAKKHNVVFVDLFTPSQKLMDGAKEKLTINGVHLNRPGDKLVAAAFDEALFGKRPEKSSADQAALLAAVNEKNEQFWYDYRAVNGFYIYGGRKAPFGIVNFPPEFAKLRKMIANRDERVWAIARGEKVSSQPDDSNTGDFADIKTNKPNILLTSPEQSQAKMTLAADYAVNLFASEEQFPELQNPVQFSWDAKGRLWVCCMPDYPMYLPGTPPNDKILILEDKDWDGKADTCKVFADGLHLPTGIALGDGGAYVALQPNLAFLKDTNGDDVADVREIVLGGFDSADSHHSISAFTWDPGGALYFQEGTFHHTQVESPYGPRRLVNAGVFRFEPRTFRFDVFVSYSFANPWGHYVDGWGQNFVADASGGNNYWGTAFSGDVDYPRKHGGMKQILKMQWRPTSGCELVSSRNFPDDAQGDYLLNNCIGFQGVLHYKMKDDGASKEKPESGFSADPVDPLLKSTDENFRPVDLEFGPDGALYLCDWYNPLVGHMQHSVRDPNRDHVRGRIWRVHYTKKPLVKPVKIEGESIATLLDLFKTEPEERTRERVRLELRSRERDQVLAEAKKWLASIDKNDKNFEHHRLEVLWLHQQQDVVNEDLLKQVLASSDYRARSAATRVLCYWRDRVAEPLALLQKQVNDEHPRVRLEALRALSFFDSQEAIDIAAEALIYPTDDYINYVYKETMDTLEPRVKAKKK